MVLPKCLNQRRVAGLAEASLMVVLLTCGYPSTSTAGTAEEQVATIGHTALQCWPAEEHIVLSADIQPLGDVQKSLLYFRWDRHAAWYFVPMMLNAQSMWVAVLPKTLPGTTGAVYYIESLSSSYTSTRSPEYRVPVKPASSCENAGAVIYTGTNPNITVGATRVGQPVPPGFDVSGIGAYINTTGITTGASTGGGISGKTLAIIGGAGGAAGAFLLAGDSSGDSTTTTDGIGGITTTAGTTTSTPAGGGTSSTTTTAAGGGGTTSMGGGNTTTTSGGATTTIGATTSGATTSGATTSGATTSGATTSGATTSGATTSIATTSGVTTSIATTSNPTTAATTSIATTSNPTTAATTSIATTSNPTTAATTSIATTSNPTTAATTSNPTTSVATTTAGSATLSVSKSGSPNPVNVGNNLTYTVRVTNTGGATATSVTIDDTIPASMLILGTSANCTVIGQRVICAMQSITPGNNKSITITVRPMNAGNFTNRATATSGTAPPASGQTNTRVN